MDNVRYAVIGIGYLALYEHLVVLRDLEGAEVRVVADTDPARLPLADAVLGYAPEKTTDPFAAIARDDVDAVLIATPNDAHTALALAAIEARKPVLLEKPMAVDLDEARSIVERAERAGVPLQVGYVLRYAHLFGRMRELIETGAVGTPRMAWVHELRRALPDGWRYQTARSGGVFVEKSCHHFDLLQWLVGQRIERVHAVGGQARLLPGAFTEDIRGGRFSVPEGADIPDHAVATLAFEGGAHGTLSLSFFAPFKHRLELGVLGDDALLVAHEDRGELHLTRADGCTDVIKVRHPEGIDEPMHKGSVEQHRQFLAAVRGEAKVVCDGLLGLEGLIPAFLAERSLVLGRPVGRDELFPAPARAVSGA